MLHSLGKESNNFLFSRLFALLGTTWVEAAEGATAIATVVAWRIHASSIEVEDVSVCRRASRTRPTAAAVADVVRLTIINIDVPATDKSQWMVKSFIGVTLRGIIRILRIIDSIAHT